MLGKRNGPDYLSEASALARPQENGPGQSASVTGPVRPNGQGSENEPPAIRTEAESAPEHYDLKKQILAALIESIDITLLVEMEADRARKEIREIVRDIVSAKKAVISTAEQERLLDDVCNDVLGYGPLEPLLARDDIADIMVNGANTIFI